MPTTFQHANGNYIEVVLEVNENHFLSVTSQGLAVCGLISLDTKHLLAGLFIIGKIIGCVFVINRFYCGQSL